MVVTDRFIFIRLQKCASRTLGEYFKKAYNSPSKVEGVHIPARKAIKTFQDRAFVGSIRNPWDWYVSWHTFIKDDPRFKDIYKPDFKEFMLHIFNKKKGKYPFINFNSINYNDIGVFAYRYIQMCCNVFLEDLISYYIRFEDIEGGIEDVCLNYPPKNFVDLPHMNKTNHKKYTDYYDDELREMVAHKDRIIIERFGYKF